MRMGAGLLLLLLATLGAAHLLWQEIGGVFTYFEVPRQESQSQQPQVQVEVQTQTQRELTEMSARIVADQLQCLAVAVAVAVALVLFHGLSLFSNSFIANVSDAGVLLYGVACCCSLCLCLGLRIGVLAALLRQ